MENIEYSFWTNVNYILKSMNSSQEKLSKEIGISLNTIRNASSRNIIPKADVALKIAKYLNTNIENLLIKNQSEIFETSKTSIEISDKEQKKAMIIEMIKEL